MTAPRLTWTRLANGDLLANEHPIRLVKPYSRRNEDPGWQIRYPIEPDGSWDEVDGWMWVTVQTPGETWPLEAASERNAKALAEESLDYILRAYPFDDDEPYPADGHQRVIEAAQRREEEDRARQVEMEASITQSIRTARTVPIPPPERKRGTVSYAVPHDRLPEGYLLSVACPYCGAGVGEPCRSAKTPGKPTSAMHSDRLAAVREAAIEAVLDAARARLAAGK